MVKSLVIVGLRKGKTIKISSAIILIGDIQLSHVARLQRKLG